MKAVFMDLPAFARDRDSLLDDGEFSLLQDELMDDPKAGDMIPGTGGLRKLRFRDKRRQKGKRSGLRVIYYWWIGGFQFWLFGVYGKGAVEDLSPEEKRVVRAGLKAELNRRRAK